MAVLRGYQSESIDQLRDGFRAGHKRQILCAATGGGKSVIMTSMIESAVQKGSRVMFICERRILVEQFSHHLDAIGIDHGVMMAGHWRFRPQCLVQIATAQTLEKMDAWPAFDVVFIDEIHACFVAGTLIDGRPIESIKVGDYVNSFNHKTGIVEQRRVAATFIHKADKLVTVKSESGESITCTEDHPVFTQNGYIKANSLSHKSVLQLINHRQHAGYGNVHTETDISPSVPPLRDGLFTFGALCVSVKKAWNTHVLRIPGVSFREGCTGEDSQKLSAKTGLLVKNAHELRQMWGAILSRVQLCGKGTQEQFSNFLRVFGVSAGPQGIHNGNQQVIDAQASAKWWTGKDATQQPHEGRHHQAQSADAATRNRSQATSSRRKWAWIDRATSVAAVFLGGWMGGRTLCAYRMQEGSWIPNLLEDRHSKQGKDDCYRSGRRESQQCHGTGAGCAEEFFTRPSRVVSVEIQKPGSLVAGGNDCEGGQFVDVFNIEVEANNNYFANGVLVHNCLRKSIKAMLDTRPNLKVIGATATPFHPEIPKYFTNVVNVITMRELVSDKFLVPFRVFVAHEIDTTGVKVVAGEWKKDDLEDRGRRIVGDVVADFIRLSGEVFGGTRKTICFSCGVAHGHELAEKFNDAGINAVQISYKDSEEYKADVLAEFAKPDTGIKIVISSDILTRGFDQPDVEHVILARPLKKSFSSHVQMVGRGARPYPGKEFALIQDHSGNWLRFAESWDELHDDGVKELSSDPDDKPRKEPTEKEKKAAKCPACGALWAGNSDTCNHCGYERPVVNKVEAVAGEMLELNGSKKSKSKEFTTAQKQDWYSQLLYLESVWKVKKYWSFAMFIKKFGHKPAGYSHVAKPAGSVVIGWCKSGFIANSKRHAHEARP